MVNFLIVNVYYWISGQGYKLKSESGDFLGHGFFQALYTQVLTIFYFKMINTAVFQ